MAGNANSGRRPSPTALKQLRGNPGRRALNDREPTPTPLATEVRPPAHLSKEARSLWRSLTKQLADLRVLTGLDLPLLEVLVIHLGRHRSLAVQLRALEDAGQIDPSIASYQRALRREAEIVKSLAASFGLTPSDRTRLHVVPLDTDRSQTLLKFLNRKRS